MVVLTTIAIFINNYAGFFPVGTIVRQFLERNLIIRLRDVDDQFSPHSYAAGTYYVTLNVDATNHSREVPYRFVGWHVVVKRRIFFFWHRTMQDFNAQAWNPQALITEYMLEPMKDAMFHIEATCNFPADFQLPRKSEVYLVFHMVGELRKVERRYQTLIRHPELVING